MNHFAKRLLQLAQLGRYRCATVLSAWNSAQYSGVSNDIGGYIDALGALIKHSRKNIDHVIAMLAADEDTGPLLKEPRVNTFLSRMKDED